MNTLTKFIAKILWREAAPRHATEARDPEVDALLEEAAALFPSPKGGDRIAEANARRTLLA